jgi:hypothetical protein
VRAVTTIRGRAFVAAGLALLSGVAACPSALPAVDTTPIAASDARGAATASNRFGPGGAIEWSNEPPRTPVGQRPILHVANRIWTQTPLDGRILICLLCENRTHLLLWKDGRV